MTHTATVEIPSIPAGPDGDPRSVDADYYRIAARTIRYQASRGNAFAGSNLTEAVAQLCDAAASALDGPAMQTFLETQDSETDR